MLKDILDAREQRAYRRNELEGLYNRAVVSFTINIPIGGKNNLKYRWLCHLAFNEYVQAFQPYHIFNMKPE
ncbi:MAG: citrate lyase holo-[acyl-carrier protein] synthase [Bacillota bacterium]|nr:citrate lyase holo-[acyl-carrier protein] synthase [Bacillota bacterium]MDD3298461.1 citrate lyase holo-[acyl-carrier protein] synthase [Bacillota bacterium]MDD3850773.1 citrate lyase holo-[acyl-carrier protein] synthase [Bacillota bacterium]MDD4707311.1 citrate lyase holo-[acyl-carrier protein] synthase [Bacillota bacterium]